jgi:hypothetical protein
MSFFGSDLPLKVVVNINWRDVARDRVACDNATLQNKDRHLVRDRVRHYASLTGSHNNLPSATLLAFLQAKATYVLFEICK